MFQYLEDTTGMEEMVKYLLTWSNAAVVPPRRALTMPAAGIVSARRGGTTAAFDQVNKYFTISSMPVVSSKYWNMVHGSNPDQIRQDEEGMQVMRELGRNMAWMLKCIEAGRAAGIEPPKKEIPVQTNFIR